MGSFTKRIAGVENNRKRDNILLMREIIRDMWHAGHSASGIARAFDKDHTTILHHLWALGIDPQKRVEEETEVTRTKKETMLAGRILVREAAIKEKRRGASVLAKARDLKSRRIEKDREVALALYKSGKSYAYIATMLVCTPQRVQGLLNYSDEYRTIIRSGAGHANKKRPVYQKTKEGVLVKTWPSVISAAGALGIPRGSITCACRGRIPSSGGFIWEYAK